MKIIKAIKISIATFLLFTKDVYAQQVDLEISWPDSPIPNGAQLTGEATIDQLMVYLFEWAMVIGAVFLFGTLVYTSFQYIISSGNPDKLSGAKRRLGSAFGGFALLLISWMLLSILNPEFAIISDVGITEQKINYAISDIDEQTSEAEKDNNFCDYALVDYQDQKTQGEEKDQIALLFREDTKLQIKIYPYSSVACKSQKNMMKYDIIEKNNKKTIKFIEAETVSNKQADYEPKCENVLTCESGGFGKDDDPCYALFEDGEPLKEKEIKYCYAEREFSLATPGVATDTGAVLFISQKEKRAINTTCLAGDKELEDGGGCTLGLFKSSKASKCTEKLISISATTPNLRVSNHDKQIDCINIYTNK